jgi:hypothetical protein
MILFDRPKSQLSRIQDISLKKHHQKCPRAQIS